MDGLARLVRFTKNYNINVTLGFNSGDDTYAVHFRDSENKTALDVKLDGYLFEKNIEEGINYALERAEKEMVKQNKTVEELTND